MKGYIRFIHHDGMEKHFVTEKNSLTGNQMYSFDNWQACYASDIRYVKSIVRDIKAKATVLEANL